MAAVTRVSTNKVKSQEPFIQLNHFAILNHTMFQRFGDYSSDKIIRIHNNQTSLLPKKQDRSGKKSNFNNQHT